MLRRQRGYASVLVLVGVLAAFGLASTFVPGLEASRNAAESELTQRAYLQQVQAALSSLYEREAATFDVAVPMSLTGAELLVRAGIRPQYGVQVAVSDRLSASGTPVAYRVIAVWLPRRSPDPATSFNTATGVFTPDTNMHWIVVSGQAFQAQRYAASLNAMQRFAAVLQNRARAKLEADPARDIGVNYFRPTTGCSPTAEEIPCLPSYVSAATVDFLTITGVDAASLRDAWGRPLEVSNTADSQTSGPPYSMSIRATTPWGSTFKVAAVQQVS